jgi:hypothetical protein
MHQLVVSKLDATWSGPWEVSNDGEDWKLTTGSLTKNLNANELQLEEDGEILRVI